MKRAVEAALTQIPNTTLGVAVSGGGDSMALLHMLAARESGLRAVTIDHGLRTESGAEAAFVARICADLNIPHTTLKWNWDKQGNLQDAARRARQQLIKTWATHENITHIATGHTLDDQAETVLLRLARGSGVDGLSGIAHARSDAQITWVRPLLEVRREALRGYLRERGLRWVEDPSNDDPRYDRVKARLALAQLQSLGIDAARLASTSDKMRDARKVLEQAALTLTDCAEVSDAGEVCIDVVTYNAAPADTRYRLMAATLQWVSGAEYRPRFNSLRNITGEKGQTLHGCVVRLHLGKIIVRRELARVQTAPVDDVWDHRWKIGPVQDGQYVAALGEKGIKQCENWRETGHKREALLTTPALWQAGDLVAAPLAGMSNGWYCRLIDKKGLHKVLITS